MEKHHFLLVHSRLVLNLETSPNVCSLQEEDCIRTCIYIIHDKYPGFVLKTCPDIIACPVGINLVDVAELLRNSLHTGDAYDQERTFQNTQES